MKYKIIEDPEYGYLRLDPLPSQVEVEKYYKEEFFSKNVTPNDSSLAAQKKNRDYLNQKWESVCNHCAQYFGSIKKISIFDIGCGFSQGLIYFRSKGMVVSGLEPTPEGVEYAKANGLDVRHSGIEDFDCADGKKYDVVTLFNVLEHLRHPAKTLIRIRKKLLKPRGLLIVDSPNEFNDFQAVANKEFGLKEWWICPPNHINYFSVTSLKRLIVKCGFAIHYSEASFPIEIFLLMGDIYVGNRQVGKECQQKRVRFEQLMRKYGKSDKLSQLYAMLADLDLGRQVMIYSTPQTKRKRRQ